ncbi:hypothetical protein ACFUN8_30255 [Streptomyces sp. NPDC057307]|uniref:hypothetical protein n=1 Tax=Streptomyces sp. NPDC057307 TaxID=3346096 RepID=UPI0036336913
MTQDAGLVLMGMQRAGRPGTGFVFQDVDGEILKASALRAKAYRHMARLGLGKVRLYEARHA